MITPRLRPPALGRWLARLGVAVLCVAGGALAYLETPTGREWLREKLCEVIEQQLGLEAQLAYVRAEPTVLPPGISLVARGIELRHPVHGRLVTATRLEVRPSLTKLLFGKLELTRVLLRRPSVRLVVRDGALVNGPTLPESSGGSSDLPLRYLEVEGGEVHVDTDSGASASVVGLDAELIALGPRAFSVNVRADGGRVFHERGVENLRALAVEGAVDLDRGVQVSRADLAIDSGRVTLRDGELPLPFAGSAAGTLDFRVDVTRLARTFADAIGVPLTGAVRGHVEARYVDERMRGEGRLVLDGVAIDGRGIGEPLELDVHFDENFVTIDRGVLHVPHDGGEVGLVGTVGLLPPFPVDVSLDFRSMQLAALLDEIGVTPNAIARWTFDGPARLRGAIAPFRLDGTIDVDSSDFFVSSGPWHAEPRERIMGVTGGHLRGRVHIDEQALSFLDLDVVTERSRLRADTVISFSDTFSVRVQTDHIDLLDISPLTTFPITGVGTLSVDIGGLYSDPVMDASGFLRGFSFDGMPLGDLEVTADFEKGGLVAHFPIIRAMHGDSRYTVNDLRLDFSEHFEVDAEIELESVTLADLYRTFHLDEDERFEPYLGLGRGHAHAHYTAGFPGDGPTGTLVTDLDLELPRMNISGFAFEDGGFRGQLRWLDFDRDFDGAELDVHELVLRKERGTLSVVGTIAQDGVLDLTVAGSRLALEETEGLREDFPLLTGEYGVLGTVGGTLSVPRMELDLTVANAAWAGRLVGGGRAYVKLTDQSDPWISALAGRDPAALPASERCVHGRLGLLNADWPADPPLRTPDGPVAALDRPQAFIVCGEGLLGQLDLDLAFGWTSVFPHRGRIGFRELDLSAFLPSSPDGESASGTITATLDLRQGDLLSERSTTGSLAVEAFAVSAGGVRVASAAPFDVELARGTARIDGAELVGNGTALALRGSISPTDLALSLEGEVGMELFAAASPALANATGVTTLRLLVRGPLDDPEVVGEAVFSDVSVEHTSLPVPVTDLTGRVEFSQRRVVIDRITGRLGEGRIAVEGSAAIDGGLPSSFELRATLADVALRPEPGLELALGGQLTATWDVSRDLPLLRGELAIDRLRYTRPVNVTPTLGELQRPTRTTVDEYDPDAEFVELDLVITQREPAEIRNDLVDLDIRIENSDRPFRIVGTNERPGALGTLSITRGSVFFRGSSFEVRRGSIDLDERTRIHPRFDVLATTDIRRAYDSTAAAYRIQLAARGDSDTFRLDATSTPALSQQDIMLLLMVGMTSSELQSLQASQLSTTALDALSTLSGFEDRISDAVRVIDEVSLTTMYHPVTNRPEPQLTVGTRVTDRIRVTASTGLTTETRSVRTTAQFRIDDHTSLEAVYDNMNRDTASAFGNLGVDVRYRLEFE